MVPTSTQAEYLSMVPTSTQAEFFTMDSNEECNLYTGKSESRAGSQRPPITSSREDRHVTRMDLMDRAATSRALSEELGSFSRQQMSARAFQRLLQQHALLTRRPWRRLPFTLHHRQERLEW
ncbi:HTH_Tnp_Tc3_2 domain-containing protein [Trichonephila clavipes]|nr:HTH_Tnp_Tc3_2 domain-containing protein [Trichonephila clavipes]